MYKKINDYELLYMVSESNNFDILYQKYQPLIYKIVKKYGKIFKSYGYEQEDLMQIGYITLFKTIHLYCEYNDSLFYTYFVSALKKAIISEIRLNESYKRRCLNISFSYDNTISNTNIQYIDIISNDNNESSNIINNYIIFKNSLSFTSSCVFELLFNGFNIEEIISLLDEAEGIIKRSIIEIRKQAKVQRFFS